MFIHSYLNILVNYFSHHNPFSFSFSFSSNNGFYNQNGGLKTLDPGLDSNLMSTYLNSETIIKNRKLKIDQAYRLHSGLKFTHNFLFSSFYRNYIDESPSSYHYSLNPLYFSHNNSYKDSILFKKMVNSFVFSSHYMKLAINHNNYIVNNHDLNKLGDIDISFSNTDTFFTQNNIDFIFNFCPIGHNKNNFIIDLDFNKEIKKTNNTFSFLWTLKKPNFFHYRNDELNSFDWNQFSSIRTISLKVKSSFDARSLMFSAICDQYSNYFYFDTIVSPNQAEDNVLYFNMKFQKKWQLKNLILHSTLCFQHSSDEEVLSVPLFLFDQKISYDRLLFSDVRLLSLVSIQLFSKYYMPSYFPLADVFYQQQQNKTGMIPLMSLDLSLYKKHVSFGFIVDNINSFFYKDESLILNYILPPANLRITIKWQFLD